MILAVLPVIVTLPSCHNENKERDERKKNNAQILLHQYLFLFFVGVDKQIEIHLQRSYIIDIDYDIML